MPPQNKTDECPECGDDAEWLTASTAGEDGDEETVTFYCECREKFTRTFTV